MARAPDGAVEQGEEKLVRARDRGVTAGVEVDVRCALPPGDMSVIVVTAINKGEPK